MAKTFFRLAGLALVFTLALAVWGANGAQAQRGGIPTDCRDQANKGMRDICEVAKYLGAPLTLTTVVILYLRVGQFSRACGYHTATGYSKMRQDLEGDPGASRIIERLRARGFPGRLRGLSSADCRSLYSDLAELDYGGYPLVSPR